jgi:CO/xanthine dehydrogenase FAD-binding subunit
VSALEYFEAADIKQARELLGRHPTAAILAGGTDLVVASRSGKRALPGSILDIHKVPQLRGIEAQGRGALRIGALTTHADLEASAEVRRDWSALSDASALVGSPATRHLGTIGGNVCNASPAMEAGSPLLVFDARVELMSRRGKRQLSFAEFVVGPGRTSAHDGEILTAVVLPPVNRRVPVGSAYLRLEYRQAMEIAVVGAAALVAVDGRGKCRFARIALTAVAPTCLRAEHAEKALQGRQVTDDAIAEAAHAAADAARPIDDVRASADYRREMVRVITSRAIERAVARARKEPSR